MVTIADVLTSWQTAGVFDYVLPFLLIFTVIFGILEATKIVGPNKGVHVIIALVIGLLALRMGFVQDFFREIFPRLGVGLAVILALLIITGLFISSEQAKYWMWGIAAVAVVVWIIVMVGSFQAVSWLSGTGFFEDYAGMIIGAVLLIGVIIAVVASKSDSTSDGTFTRQVFHSGK
jgi:hypothetical protein